MERLQNLIKKSKDEPTIIISGNVVEKLNGKYAIKIVTNFDSSRPHASELTANNIEEIEDKISILLLNIPTLQFTPLLFHP